MSERGRETGDRAAFLGRLRSRAEMPPPVPGPHPAPAAPDTVPELRWKVLDDVDATPAGLLPVFVSALERAGATVHRGEVIAALRRVVEEHGAESIAVSDDVEPDVAAEVIETLGLRRVASDPASAAGADIGLTSAVWGLATTGSVVVDADRAGGRSVSLLPAVHVCLLPVACIVATTADVLRTHRDLPSNRVLISGPSRTGDIEQILTVGIHGPKALHLVLVD